jgi:ATP adenylyltransferase
MACEICDTPWPELGALRHWRIAVAREQNYLGKCIIALRRHEEDFLALREDEREEMWQAASAVRDALTRCFAPDRFNYQVLGNSVPHVHMQLTADERDEMWQAASAVRDALTRSFGPDHFNYQVLGNSVPHVHMHLTPRYTSPREFAGVTFTDVHWGTWPFPADQEPPGLLKALADAISREMPSKGDAK